MHIQIVAIQNFPVFQVLINSYIQIFYLWKIFGEQPQWPGLLLTFMQVDNNFSLFKE